MGELHHEETGPGRPKSKCDGSSVPLPYACEVHFHLRVSDDNVVGGWDAENLIKAFCECGGWVHSDRAERRGPKAVCIHLVYVAPGRPKAVRRGLERIISSMAVMESGEGKEIGLDSYCVPLLY